MLRPGYRSLTGSLLDCEHITFFWNARGVVSEVMERHLEPRARDSEHNYWAVCPNGCGSRFTIWFESADSEYRVRDGVVHRTNVAYQASARRRVAVAQNWVAIEEVALAEARAARQRQPQQLESCNAAIAALDFNGVGPSLDHAKKEARKLALNNTKRLNITLKKQHSLLLLILN